MPESPGTALPLLIQIYTRGIAPTGDSGVKVLKIGRKDSFNGGERLAKLTSNSGNSFPDAVFSAEFWRSTCLHVVPHQRNRSYMVYLRVWPARATSPHRPSPHRLPSRVVGVRQIAGCQKEYA